MRLGSGFCQRACATAEAHTQTQQLPYTLQGNYKGHVPLIKPLRFCPILIPNTFAC